MPIPHSLTVVILTYQRPDELDGVLENLLAQHRPPDEILVIDNDPAGSGRSAKWVDSPLVRYFSPGQNLGVAGGRNYAAAEAQGDLLFFLDDDSRLPDPHALQQALAAFDADDIGCLACLIRNAATQEIVAKEYPGFTTARWNEPHDVGYFLGGACAIRRSVFLELGGYDDVLFYDGEELEFSFRLLAAGWRIRYTPTVLTLHLASLAGRSPTKSTRWLIRNRLYVAMKHLPLPYLLSYVTVWGGFALWRALRGRDLGGFAQGLRSLRADGLLQRARQYRRAHPMQRSTVQYLRKHEGRLYY